MAASGAIRRVIVSTAAAPKAIGPYSQAVKANGMVYLSGQLGLDSKSMNLVSDSVVEQTKQALTNMKHVLEAANSDIASVVKTTVFLPDMNDYPEVNKAYAEFFPVDPPARSAVQVARLPKDAKVEIEAIALAKDTSANL